MAGSGSVNVARLRHAMWVVFLVSLAGIGFSGVLSYREIFGSAASCPSPGAPGTILGYPACVYGLVMYVVLALVSGVALARTTERRAA